ncbi:hypothetical protein CCP3SC1_520031 [Gammaproteobacteria bacterium]
MNFLIPADVVGNKLRNLTWVAAYSFIQFLFCQEVAEPKYLRITMTLISWNDRYKTDIAMIDQQHQELFDIVNYLHDAILCGKDREVLSETLTEIAEYTSVHFATEENYMLYHRYPGYAAHKKEHDSFKWQVENLLNEFASGEKVLSISLIVFIKDWLDNHLLRIDAMYKSYLTERMT